MMFWRPALALILFAFTLPAQPPHTMFPAVRGTKHMAGGGNPFEAMAGFRILEQGGNAIDAGVAGTLAAVVTEQDHIGMGGEMPLIIKIAGKPVVVISGVGVAPAKATVEYYSKRMPEPWERPDRLAPIPSMGIRAAITPGLVDGLLLALEKYGTMSFAQVAAPAIESADGWPASEIYSDYMQRLRQPLELWPASQKFFYPTGTAAAPGEIVKMAPLAATLREMVAAEKKARGNRAAKIRAVHDYFYKGPIAKRIAKYSEENGGLIAYSDLSNFKAEVDEPRTTTYRGLVINKPGFWTQGPVMLEMLNILEGFDLKKMGHNSPEYLHTVIEAAKLAFADRDRFYGDPKFSKIPEVTLLSKEYAAERRKLIDPAKASMESRPGSINASSPASSSGPGKSANNDTTCIQAVDSKGNVFSATPSGAWLPSVIAGDTGIPFSVRLESFVVTPGHANQLAPGKRPRVTLSPTMVTTKEGDLYFTLSTPGGDNQDQALLQVMLNIIEFGMTPQEAVEAPRFQTDHFYASFGNHEFTPGNVALESRIGRTTADKLTALGHKANLRPDWTNSSSPVVIMKKNGALHGAADPRRSRFILGR